jgi:hypothetical protein
MTDKLSRVGFAGHIHSKFRVLLQNRSTLELELYELADGRSTPVQEQFSLFFYGPTEPFLGQGTFQLEHQALGDFPLFLVPVGPDERGMCYEAVFNRFLGKTQ